MLLETATPIMVTVYVSLHFLGDTANQTPQNGVGSGSYNGNGNTFGNGNAIGSDNSGISILKRRSGSNIVGSALSNLNGNGNDNS